MSTTIATPSITGSATGTVSWWGVVLCFLTVLLDGFDTISIGLVVPTMAREWNLPPSAFTLTFMGTSLGAVVGYVCSGWFAARYSRRGVMINSVMLFALGSLLTAFATSIHAMSWLRLLTGIGLGSALPAAISLAVQYGPQHRREAVTIGVAAGLVIGSTAGGAMAGRLIAQFGWSAIFLAGSLLPFLLLPVLWWGLPTEDKVEKSIVDAPRGASVSSLMEGGMAVRTVLLWCFALLNFTTFYALIFWVPTLLGSFGFSPREAPLGAVALGIGGIFGTLLLVPLSACFSTQRVLVVTALLTVVLITCVSKLDFDRVALLLVLGGIGAGLNCGTIGQSALAVSLYPPASRVTGIGWAAAFGRVGAVIGPAIGGMLMSLGAMPRDIVLSAFVPMLLAALVVLAMNFVSRDINVPHQ
jgi:MFS transporter, AAHS family, 4-hydroxybenzoate transporter